MLDPIALVLLVVFLAPACSGRGNHDSGSECGDGLLEWPEICDGTDFGGQSCESLGYTGGQLVCTAGCVVDTTGCFDPECGNRVCEVNLAESHENCIEDCGWVSIAAGRHHTCGVKGDGTVWCWGRNENGRLGDGTYEDRLVPVRVVDPVEMQGLSATEIVVGHLHSCLLNSDGTVWCWGLDGSGLLGDGQLHDSCWADIGRDCSNIPVRAADLEGVVSISAHWEHTCALNDDGTVSCWGDNFYGPLGDGTTVDRDTPVSVQGLSNVVSISAGHMRTCAVKADGSVWCWGNNSCGSLGDGTASDQHEPAMVLDFEGVVTVSTGGAHTCALRDDDSVWCWGNNVFGQLGDGLSHESCNGDDVSTVPVEVPNLPGIRFISAGASHTCVQDREWTPWCWGNNVLGELGNGTTGLRSLPVTVVGTLDAVSLSAGILYTCATRQDGTAWCWGLNEDGQLGIGDNTGPETCEYDNEYHPCSTTPVPVVDPY